MKNKAAVALGRLGKGIKKTITPAERAKRAARLRAAALAYNAKRKAGLVIHPARGPSKIKLKGSHHV